MRALPAASSATLAPLRAEIRARAAAAALALEEDAAGQAKDLVARAEGEAESITRRALDAGAAAARADAAQRSARERRRAHELELEGREALRRDLEERVVARASALLQDAAYPDLLDALRRHAVEVLGPAAVLEEHPDGGIVATAGNRRLDLRLPVLARATLASMAEEVSPLWLP